MPNLFSFCRSNVEHLRVLLDGGLMIFGQMDSKLGSREEALPALLALVRRQSWENSLFYAFYKWSILKLKCTFRCCRSLFVFYFKWTSGNCNTYLCANSCGLREVPWSWMTCRIPSRCRRASSPASSTPSMLVRGPERVYSLIFTWILRRQNWVNVKSL